MKPRLILGSGAAVLFVFLLAWLLRDLAYRYLVIPIQYLAWGIKVTYLTLPHGWIWAGFLVLTYLVAVNSLYRPQDPLVMTRARSKPYAEQRISLLSRYLYKRKRPFYRHRIKFVLTDLALQVITQKKRITLLEARNLINHNELDVPPTVLVYLKDGLLPWEYGSIKSQGFIQELLQRRRREKEADEINMQVLKYIEEQMEIERDGNSPSL